MTDKALATEIGAFLEARLASLGTEAVMFYGDIAMKYGLPDFEGDAWVNHPLCKIFEILDREDAGQQRPFRTVIVIGKNSNLPGPGLFRAMVEMGRIKKAPKSDSEKFKIYLQEINEAVAYYNPG